MPQLFRFGEANYVKVVRAVVLNLDELKLTPRLRGPRCCRPIKARAREQDIPPLDRSEAIGVQLDGGPAVELRGIKTQSTQGCSGTPNYDRIDRFVVLSMITHIGNNPGDFCEL